MTILLDADTRVCVVGATGRTARRDLAHAVEYGTRVVCGVAPGHGGEHLEGVPLFDAPAEAAAEAPFDAAVAYLPPSAYASAMPELLASTPQWVAVITEGIPLHDNVRVLGAARAAGVRLVGPAINGIISPGVAKVGMVDHRGGAYGPGPVGVISRSGGQQNELAHHLRGAGLGISTAVPVGGDAVAGSGFGDLAELFEADPGTEAIVVYAEAGPDLEDSLVAAARDGRVRKPVIALVTGDWLEGHTPGRTFGHAGSFLDGPRMTASSKRERLAAAGVSVVVESGDIAAAVRAALRG